MSAMVADQKPEIGSIFRQGAIAVVVAVVVNLILFFIGAAVGAFPPDALTPTGQPVAAPVVAIMSLGGGVVGTIGYLVLTRFLSLTRANLIFGIVVILVLVAMFFTPFGIKGAPMLQIVLLEIMHVVVGGALLYFLLRS